jgi:hypothetical protein
VGSGSAAVAGAGLDARPGTPAGDVLPPRDARCDPVSRGQRDQVAGDARRLPAVGPGVRVLPRWRENALVKEFHDRLRAQVREWLGRDAEPTAGVINSQSVKADAVVGADSRGFDGGKLINGRKRHVVVDTLGLLGVMVTSADVGDRTAAQVLLARVADAHHRLALIWADGGYTGSLVEYCLAAFALVVSIVKRSDARRGSWCCPSGGSSSASSPT